MRDKNSRIRRVINIIGFKKEELDKISYKDLTIISKIAKVNILDTMNYLRYER